MTAALSVARLAADALDPPEHENLWLCDRPDCDGKPHDGWPRPHARANQHPPPGDWLAWLILAGRGFGKTRSGAEWMRERALTLPGSRGALVAATYPDGRDTMVEGESGLLAVLAPSMLRGGAIETAWNRSIGELYLANGSRLKVFTSEKPGRLRGPQHHHAWGDEPAEWDDAEVDEREKTKGTTWSNLLFGLRLGADPRAMLTGTPKPNRLIKTLVWRDGNREHGPRPDVVVTRGSTYDNLDNLAPRFAENILGTYEGTTLGKQELHAEILDDNPRALWRRSHLERDRVRQAPALPRIIVGVDPSGGAGEQGIIVAGKGADDHGYVLDDRSCKLSPDGWGRRAVLAWADWSADLIVVEVNFGGDMAKRTITAAAEALLAEGAIEMLPAVKILRASRGKRARAEPVSALYEQGRVHHVGALPKLEDQMADWVPDESAYSPDRVDALVWAATELRIGGAGAAGFGGLAMARTVLGGAR